MLSTETNPLSRSEFEWFRGLIERETGLYILDYKVQFLTNRLLKRMSTLGIDTFADYRSMIEEEGLEGNELKILLEEIVVFESWFFRNTRQFEIFTDVILENLLSDKIMKGKRAIFNILGCSAGQEPYSLAILLKENLPPDRLNMVRINAIDISLRLLNKAELGIYRDYELNGLSPGKLVKYFDKLEEGYRIKPEISRMVNFFQFNLKETNWNKFRFGDVIFCRNTLIYFRDKTRKEILNRMIRSLREGGFLLLGHSEILNREDFDNISYIDHSIYRKVRQ